MDEPVIGTTTSAPASPAPPPRTSRADLWTTALAPLPWVAVLLVLAFVALRLVRRYVEKG